MSVELALFPQTTSNGSFAPVEYLSDGQDFITLNASSIYTHGGTNVSVGAAVVNQFPTTPNAWYRAEGSNIVTEPTQVSGNVLFTAPAAIATAAIYQNVDGLIAGEQYTVTINCNSFAAGSLAVFHHNGLSGGLQNQSIIFSGTTTLTLDITGTTTGDNIIYIRAATSGSNNITVTNVSVTEFATNTSYEGQVIVDLYENEEIPLTLSVDDFKNAAEKTQSYSKDFNLPATKRNNQVFGHIFEITRSVGNPPDFNPLVFTRAVLKQDGFILFDGALRLIDIQDRNGEISYNVNLYAQTIALATILKNRTFANIDFSELEHAYQKDNIKASANNSDGLQLNNDLSADSYAKSNSLADDHTNVLKYPFVDWTGNWLIGDGSATGNAGNVGFPEFSQLEDIYRPWLQIKYLLDRVFSEAGYTYTCDLFDTADFKRLFMDFNWGGQTVPALIDDTNFTANRINGTNISVSATPSNIEYYPAGFTGGSSGTGGDVTSQVPSTYSTTNFRIEETVNATRYVIKARTRGLVSGTGSSKITTRFKHTVSATSQTFYYNTQVSTISTGSTFNRSNNVDVIINSGDTLALEILEITNFGSPTVIYSRATCTWTVSSGTITSAHLLNLRGDLNQWNFVSGILKMFNLVTLQDPTNAANIIIKTYNDAFTPATLGTTLEDRSITHDWTDKVDLKDVKLTPLTDLAARTVFRFEEDDSDYIFKVYKRSTQGFLYGSKVFNETNLTLLEGQEEIVASPFAATLNKPIMSQFGEFIVPTIYSMGSDGVGEPFDNLPRICYQVTTDSAAYDISQFGYTFYIPAQNGLSSENSTKYLLFSHLEDLQTIPGTTFDYNFGECQYIQGQGVTVTDNLFNEFWSTYYYELYNPDTKTMTLKVNLTAADIATFDFTKYVMIKNRSFRVNRIDYKPKDLSTVEFILIP